jgi:hypothetical protein
MIFYTSWGGESALKTGKGGTAARGSKGRWSLGGMQDVAFMAVEAKGPRNPPRCAPLTTKSKPLQLWLLRASPSPTFPPGLDRPTMKSASHDQSERREGER